MENTVQPIQPNQPPAPAPVEKKSWITRKTLLLIALLILALLILLAVALFPKNTSLTKTTPLVNKPAASVPETILSLANSTSASSSAYKAVDVLLKTDRTKITAVQLELAYDPKAISGIDVTPGPFFTNPAVLLKKIDVVNGRISYVLGVGSGQTLLNGKGAIAVIQFTPTLQKDSTVIDFLPKSEVTSAGQGASILTSTRGIELQLK